MPLSRYFKKILAWGLIVSFGSISANISRVQAGEVVLPFMPRPGTMVQLSPAYVPASIKGIAIHPENAFEFDFIVDRGSGALNPREKSSEYNKLVKYFLASLAVPDKDQWVNLSPYEKGRIIEDNFGTTEMGRDLLAQDYLLKQTTASMFHPQGDIGRRFWTAVYMTGRKKFGTTSLTVSTLNKVWIVPEEAVICEKGHAAYVLKSRLKVMLEQDYAALQHHGRGIGSPHQEQGQVVPIIRSLVIPQLTKEVNEGKNFAPLRQAYSAMLLAAWYKQALKRSILGQIYANKSKTQGTRYDRSLLNGEAAGNGDDVEMIYNRYVTAYKKGVFNFVSDGGNGGLTPGLAAAQPPRKYFSGGMVGYGPSSFRVVHTMDRAQLSFASLDVVRVRLKRLFEGGDDSKRPSAIRLGSKRTLRDMDGVDNVYKWFLNFERSWTQGDIIAGVLHNPAYDQEGAATALKRGIERKMREAGRVLPRHPAEYLVLSAVDDYSRDRYVEGYRRLLRILSVYDPVDRLQALRASITANYLHLGQMGWHDGADDRVLFGDEHKIGIIHNYVVDLLSVSADPQLAAVWEKHGYEWEWYLGILLAPFLRRTLFVPQDSSRYVFTQLVEDMEKGAYFAAGYEEFEAVNFNGLKTVRVLSNSGLGREKISHAVLAAEAQVRALRVAQGPHTMVRDLQQFYRNDRRDMVERVRKTFANPVLDKQRGEVAVLLARVLTRTPEEWRAHGLVDPSAVDYRWQLAANGLPPNYKEWPFVASHLSSEGKSRRNDGLWVYSEPDLKSVLPGLAERLQLFLPDGQERLPLQPPLPPLPSSQESNRTPDAAMIQDPGIALKKGWVKNYLTRIMPWRQPTIRTLNFSSEDIRAAHAGEAVNISNDFAKWLKDGDIVLFDLQAVAQAFGYDKRTMDEKQSYEAILLVLIPIINDAVKQVRSLGLKREEVYAFQELFKNAIIHGNAWDTRQPVYVWMEWNSDGTAHRLHVIDMGAADQNLWEPFIDSNMDLYMGLTGYNMGLRSVKSEYSLSSFFIDPKISQRYISKPRDMVVDFDAPMHDENFFYIGGIVNFEDILKSLPLPAGVLSADSGIGRVLIHTRSVDAAKFPWRWEEELGPFLRRMFDPAHAKGPATVRIVDQWGDIGLRLSTNMIQLDSLRRMARSWAGRHQLAAYAEGKGHFVSVLPLEKSLSVEDVDRLSDLELMEIDGLLDDVAPYRENGWIRSFQMAEEFVVDQGGRVEVNGNGKGGVTLDMVFPKVHYDQNQLGSAKIGREKKRRSRNLREEFFRPDSAMTAPSPADKGGIDFNASNVNLQVKGDGNMGPVLTSENLAQFDGLQGLEPLILSITPARQAGQFRKLFNR